ncbi:hypothetical protein HMPREF3222_01383 [Clostridium perfringens]|uniref:Uncharacterized protein n=1 Tax=Clostridium perfringens TaxID=1502 RepID=A0A133N7P2_CLOPF|nr:hypothetical protein HMPREF3222_01383 [Clostridium perfringens]
MVKNSNGSLKFAFFKTTFHGGHYRGQSGGQYGGHLKFKYTIMSPVERLVISRFY